MPHVTQRVCTHPGCERFAKANTEGEWLYCKSHMHQYGMWPRDYRPQADKPLRPAGRKGMTSLSGRKSKAGGGSAAACSSAADGYSEDAATALSRAQSVAPGITDAGTTFATAPLAASRLMEVKDEASAPAFDPAFFASVLLPPLGEEDEELWVPYMTSPSAPDAPLSDVRLRNLDMTLPSAACSSEQPREPPRMRTGPRGGGARTVADVPSGAALPAAPRRGRNGGRAPPGTAATEIHALPPAPDCVVAACSDDPLLPRPTSLTTVLTLAAAAAWGSFHETSPSGEFICAGSGGGGPAAAPRPPNEVAREEDKMLHYQAVVPPSSSTAPQQYSQEAVQPIASWPSLSDAQRLFGLTVTAGPQPQPQTSPPPASRLARSSFIHPPAAMAPPLPPPEAQGEWLSDHLLSMLGGEASVGKVLPQLDPAIQEWLSSFDPPSSSPTAGLGDWEGVVDRQHGTDIGGGSSLGALACAPRGALGEEDVSVGASPRREASAQLPRPPTLEMLDAQPSLGASAPRPRPPTFEMLDAQASAPAAPGSRPPTIEMQNSRPPSHEMASMQLSR